MLCCAEEDLGGGFRWCAPPPPPLREYLIQLMICKKRKKTVAPLLSGAPLSKKNSGSVPVMSCNKASLVSLTMCPNLSYRLELCQVEM